MTELRRRLVVDAAEAQRWTAARQDVVREVEAAPGRFTARSGPFHAYERTVTATSRSDGTVEIDQHVRFRLALGLWSGPFVVLLRRTLREPPQGVPWWAPPDVLDRHGAIALSSLASLTLVSGYLGTLITQTITFASDEFDASNRVQGDTLAGVRIGVLLSLLVAAWADRHGRRRALLWCAVGGCLAASLGSVAPSMAALGASQVVARGLSTAMALLITVVAAEEMPAGSRAYAASLLTMSAALGAGVCLWVLPLADVGESAWRVLYLLPLLYLPLVRSTARVLPESRRFVRRHAEAHWRGHLGRLVLLASSGFLVAFFTTPASQLQNEFLREDHGFSAAQLSLFTILTVTPGSIGIVVGGRLADTRGRRIVGAVGLLGGVGFTVLQYLGDGASLWLFSACASIIGGLTVPALTVYGPELFPTGLRGKANGVITAVAVAGSATGLVLAGRLAERWGLGEAIAALAIGPLIVVALVLTLYPETAHRELEELNPEDADFVVPVPLA